MFSWMALTFYTRACCHSQRGDKLQGARTGATGDKATKIVMFNTIFMDQNKVTLD